jgi:hypothetical protein
VTHAAVEEGVETGPTGEDAEGETEDDRHHEPTLDHFRAPRVPETQEDVTCAMQIQIQKDEYQFILDIEKLLILV